MIAIILTFIVLGIPISVYFQMESKPSLEKFIDFLKGVFLDEDSA